MFPSTVISDRSLLPQIVCSARRIDSRICTGVAGGAWAASDLHRRAVRQLAHRIERPGDHLVARLQSREHLEVALAGDADLHRLEHDAPVADDEHAFRFLPRLAGRRLGGACVGATFGVPKNAALHRRRRLVDERALLVEQHLAHGERLDRHRDDVPARGGRDLCRAREARADVGHRLVDRDHHLEVRGLALPVVCVRGRLDRAVADLGDVALEHPVGHRVDRHDRLLADRHVGECRSRRLRSPPG